MRSILQLSLFVPALAAAALYTGTVSSLENQPLAGVVVKLGSDSVITGQDGRWSLAGSVGVRPGSAKAIDGTRHLVLVGSRLSLRWQDHDILGRNSAMHHNVPSSQSSTALGRKMSASSSDTVVVRWKGKNLSRIPVPPSDTNIVHAIDTSWKDDARIPWNPSIAYGSLPDTRDGQTYRTTTIGTQKWMAENLNLLLENGKTHTINAEMYGQLYPWATAMGLPDSCNPDLMHCAYQNPNQGICPIGWHIPTEDEVFALNAFTGAESNLSSSFGWLDGEYGGNGSDAYGFRFLPGGFADTYGARRSGYVGKLWNTWTSWGFKTQSDLADRYFYRDNGRVSVRCLNDTLESYPDSVAAPVFSLPGGTYSAPQTATISSATSGATIYYTTNGQTPKSWSSKYTSPVTIGANQTLKAIAVKKDMAISSMTTSTYVITTGDTATTTP